MKKNILLVSGLVLLVVFAFSLFFLSPPGRFVSHKNGKTLRVRIARDADSADISSPALCEVIKPSTGEIILRGFDVKEESKVRIFGEKILVGNKSFREQVIKISPRNRSGFFFNGIKYRGNLDLIRDGRSFSVINRVDLEDYLKGVVSREVHSLWPMAALKAQAVASRSYAVYEAARRKNLPYDLTADTFTQVYGGRTAERSRTTSAVVTTAGEVLKYKGKLIPGYFHSSCGGHTTSVSKVWGGADIEPLSGRRSPYCRWTPAFRWRARVSSALILDKLNSSGYTLDRIDNIRVGKVDVSGRLEYVRVKSRNKWFEVPIRDFRGAIGRRTLKSSNFCIRKYPLFYDFNGYGWGHGVGMCQWCAFGLSLRRWNYIDILGFFYPGSVVVDME